MAKKTKPMWWKLVLSLIVDAVGMTSYSIPFIGEQMDVIWGPISAFIIYMMYDNIYGAGLGLVEELGPGTDIIPTATLLWFYETFKR